MGSVVSAADDKRASTQRRRSLRQAAVITAVRDTSPPSLPASQPPSPTPECVAVRVARAQHDSGEAHCQAHVQQELARVAITATAPRHLRRVRSSSERRTPLGAAELLAVRERLLLRGQPAWWRFPAARVRAKVALSSGRSVGSSGPGRNR